MNRKYTREWYLERVAAIRRIIPDCGLSIFFHVFTPEEPKGRVKDTMPKFPEGDISFLLDIRRL